MRFHRTNMTYPLLFHLLGLLQEDLVFKGVTKLKILITLIGVQRLAETNLTTIYHPTNRCIIGDELVNTSPVVDSHCRRYVVMRLSTADCFGFTILRARRLTTCSNKWQLVIFCSLTTIITILINSPMSMCRHLICGQGMVVLSIRSESRKSHT